MADSIQNVAGEATTQPTKSTSTPPPAVEGKSQKTKPNARPAMKSRNASMNGPLYMQTANNKVLIRRVKRKDDGVLKSLARWFLENQIGFSFNLIALLFLSHICMPKARPYTSKFFALSNYDPATGLYAAGSGDLYFIVFCIVLFTGLRAFFMEHLLAPAAKLGGITKRKDITRFSEQAWLLVYYLVFWPLGWHLYSQSKYYLNMQELWTDWPIRELGGVFKVYMLAQWAFWVQQVLVIFIEERRKDHYQMLTHHFVTITLLTTSYAYHYTRVAHLILLLMDIVDLFLPIAKCLKYMGYTTICDAMFGLFVVSWFLARHVFYMMTCWSIYVDVPEIISYGCYQGPASDLKGPFPVPEGWGYLFEPFKDPAGIVCLTKNIRWGFLGCLLFLQVITLMWFFMIIQVVIRVLRGAGADDVRSDDEGGAEEEEEYEYEEAEPLEEEVGVEDLDLKNWERRTGVKRTATTSGVSLPGHSDRKELLGRIGCEKQVD